MSVHRPESSIVFLLGAGFSVDAGLEVGSLVTVYTIREAKIRLISVRRATKREVKDYEG